MNVAASHILLPLAVYAVLVAALYRRKWRPALMLMSAAFLLDLDHLAATPVFDPNRCSLGCHPLHSREAVALYPMLLCHPRLFPLALGLAVHLGLDGLDCLML